MPFDGEVQQKNVPFKWLHGTISPVYPCNERYWYLIYNKFVLPYLVTISTLKT